MGPNCEFTKHPTEDSPTVLRGDLVVTITGSKHNVMGQLKEILRRIGQLIHVYVRVRLGADGRPMIYEYDRDSGERILLDTTNQIDVNDKTIVHGQATSSVISSTSVQKTPKNG
jgi:hypothetical protein